MRAASKWLRRQRSVFRRGILVVLLSILGVAVAHDASAASKSASGGATFALPKTSAEVAAFVAPMDDRQVRSLLVRTLEERTRESEPMHEREMLTMLEAATGRLAARVGQIFGAAGEVVISPVVFWRWLTMGGSDPTGPWRALTGGFLLIGIGWLAQAAAALAIRKSIPLRAGTELASHRVAAALMLLRFMALLGALAAAHALLPEVMPASRLTALAAALTFAGTWIASLTISSVLPALLASDSPPSVVIRTGILRLAFGIFFAGVFGVVLLRHAGMSQDARMFIATVTWLVFGLLFPFAFSRRREAVAEITAEALPHRDPIERWLDQHGALLLRLAFVAIFIITPLVALARGPTAFWSGIASFALVLLVVAALGLARTPPPAPLAANAFAEPPSPGMRALRRAARFLTVVGFVLGLAYVWHIDLFEAANTHLGDTVARGIVTLIITVAVAYLVWDLIRMALAQSVLGPPRAAGERGEEGGGTAATRLQTFGPVLRNFLFVVVVTIATLVGLSSLGVNIGPLLAGAGVIGIALGFGAQTLVRDVISGVFFLAEDAFRIGEYVVIGNTRGTVEGIAIRSLKLRHHRGSLHTVPFGEIKQLTNESRDWIILKLEFLLAFDTDLRKVRQVVKEISKQLEADPELGHALLEPVKSQGVRRMEPTGMVIGLKIVAKPGSEVYLIRREVFHRVRDAFEQNGIHFARPQVVVAALGGAVAQLPDSPDQLAAAAALNLAPAPVKKDSRGLTAQ
jgi:moderate conductance mechanosensitive channel